MQFLHREEIGASIQQVSGEAALQIVWREDVHTYFLAALSQNVIDTLVAETPSFAKAMITALRYQLATCLHGNSQTYNRSII